MTTLQVVTSQNNKGAKRAGYVRVEFTVEHDQLITNPSVMLNIARSPHLSLSPSMRKSRRYSKNGKGVTSDPQNSTPVEHRQFGVWDLYIERDQKLSYFPTSWRIEEYTRLHNDLPYLWRTIRDVGAEAWPLLLLYVVVTLLKSLVPALSLWCVHCTCRSFSETLDN